MRRSGSGRRELGRGGVRGEEERQGTDELGPLRRRICGGVRQEEGILIAGQRRDGAVAVAGRRDAGRVRRRPRRCGSGGRGARAVTGGLRGGGRVRACAMARRLRACAGGSRVLGGAARAGAGVRARGALAVMLGAVGDRRRDDLHAARERCRERQRKRARGRSGRTRPWHRPPRVAGRRPSKERPSATPQHGASRLVPSASPQPDRGKFTLWCPASTRPREVCPDATAAARTGPSQPFHPDREGSGQDLIARILAPESGPPSAALIQQMSKMPALSGNTLHTSAATPRGRSR